MTTKDTTKTRKPRTRNAAAKKSKKSEEEEVPMVAEVQEASEETAIALPGLPGMDLDVASGAQDYGDQHSASTARVTDEERIVDTLRVVQDSSKIWQNKTDDQDIELGDIYSTASGRVYKANSGVLLVPIKCTACVIQRTAAPDGKYIKKLHVDNPEVVEAFKNNNGDGWKKLENRRRETLNYTDEVACALIDPQDGVTVLGLVVVPFHGTNVFPRKQWWNRMAEQPGNTPYYAFRTVLKTELRKGPSKDSYRYVAEAYGGNWQRCRFAPSHPNMAGFLELLGQYESGDLGETNYADADSGPNEEAQEKAAF